MSRNFLLAFAIALAAWLSPATVAAAPQATASNLASASEARSPPPVLPVDAAAPGGEALRVSVLTFGPGRIYWERFGHDAILIRNLANGTAIAYNYGIFDFSQAHFFLNFARGYMYYRMSADPLQADLDFYAAHGRSVTEQRLNLTPAQRLSLARFLQWNVLPANTRYRYDYFLSNCSTRVRDALNRVLGGALKRQLSAHPAQHGHTYRFDAVRALAPDRWLAMAMDVALGPAADRPLTRWQDSFLPVELSRSLDHVTLTNAEGNPVPLVTSTNLLVPGRVRSMPAQPPDWTPPLLAAGLGIAIVLLLLNLLHTRGAARFAFAAVASLTALGFGLGGVVLALIWGVTQHWAGWHNENLLLFDPLCLLLIPAWLGSARRNWQASTTRRALAMFVALAAVAALVIRALPGAGQANLAWAALALPIHVVLAGCLWSRAARRRRLPD